MKTLFKKIYNALPFKKQFFMLLKKIYRPGPNTYKHLHFKGVLTIPINESQSFKINHHGYQIENELFWGGIGEGFEKESVALWIKLCQRSEIILDIGANTGVYSLVAKTLNKNSKVYAFEPVTRVFEKLEANVRLNNFEIHCSTYALSDKNGKAIIFDPCTEHLYSVTVNKNLTPSNKNVKQIEIETITLDTIVEKYRLQKIDLMKVDVETHEPEVMRGFNTYLKKFQPTMLMEILSDEVGSQLQTIFKDMDYLYFNIDERKGIRQVENITKSDYWNYLICRKEIARELKLIP